jgi:hypothetical protein
VKVFRDESSLLVGNEFTKELREEIARTDVFLALVDADWTGSKQTGRSRLLDAKDVVRQEIAQALQDDRVLVVPVLVDGARMPPDSEFPDEIAGMALRHASTLDQAQAHFDESLQFVLGEIVKTISQRKIGEDAEEARLQRLSALQEIDPEAAEVLQATYGSAIAALPRFVEGVSEGGKGVPLGTIQWHGTWECTASTPNWRVTLRFEAEPLPHSPFRGRLLTSQGSRQPKRRFAERG